MSELRFAKLEPFKESQSAFESFYILQLNFENKFLALKVAETSLSIDRNVFSLGIMLIKAL
jgi:hypothetical protein